MNLSWSVLALALIGAGGQQPSQPKTPSPPILIEIDISGASKVGSESCRKAATAIAVPPDSRTETSSSDTLMRLTLSAMAVPSDGRPETEVARKAGAMAKLVDFCIERSVDLVVDTAKTAIVAKLTEPPGFTAKADTCPKGAEYGMPPAGVASSTLPPGFTAKADTCPKGAEYGMPPAGVASSTLPMKLPKVAKPRTINDAEAAEAWPMTLRDACRIALDNSEVVRVIAFGAQGIPIGGFEPTPLKACTPPNDDTASSSSIVIARLNADAAPFRFKAEIMAEVRSVEQQYWSLAQAHVQLWAADRAVSLGQEVLKREQAEMEVGRGTIADVVEAAQRLEQFNLDLVTRTSDVITSERQLRNLLGLPPSDNRRIIPVTPPTEQLIEYDWDTCLHEMRDEQPDIVQQKTMVRVAELQLLIARNQSLPQLSLDALCQLDALGQRLDSPFAGMTGATLKALDPLRSNWEKAADPNAKPDTAKNFVTYQSGGTFQMPLGMRTPLANSRQAQYILLRSRAYLKQIEHQTTHSLARFFLGVDANYKQYKTSVRLRAAAAQRLDAQRAYYEEGRITIDRFLDAVSQYATAVATEAQYKTTYNVSLAALAEAKGTLLADRNIVIAESPHPRKPYVQAARPKKPVPAVPAPGRWAAILHPRKWKGTKDLMTVATAFAADMPEALEVPPVRAFTIPPLSVNDVSCCDVGPESASTVATAATPGTSAKCDAECTLTSSDDASTAVKAGAPARSKTWTFSLSIGGGASPLQIKGTVTETEAGQPAAVGH